MKPTSEVLASEVLDELTARDNAIADLTQQLSDAQGTIQSYSQSANDASAATQQQINGLQSQIDALTAENAQLRLGTPNP